jgi:hypothetical protein
MSFVPCVYARLLAPTGLGAFLLALAAIPAAAEPPDVLPGLRTTLDGDAEPSARLRRLQPPKRVETPDRTPVGQVPAYGSPPGSGAGKTGFVSLKPRARRPTALPAAPALPPPLPLSPSGFVVTPDRAVADQTAPEGTGREGAGRDTAGRDATRRDGASPERAAAAGAAKPAPPPLPRGPAKPVTPPKPPALAHRAELKEQLNAQPNTVVAVPRKPEEDPFEAIGYRAGAFLLRPAFETTGGYDSNPGRVQGGKGSAFIAPAAELVARSDWERHELTAEIRGSYTAFQATPELDAPYLASKVDGRIDVSERTRVLLEGRYLMSAANPGLPGLPAGLAELPIYQTPGATAGIIHRFNRLEVGVKGTFDRTEWGDSKLTDGTIISNKDRDYDQVGVDTRVGYEVTPGFKPFVDVAVDTRSYDLPIDAGGIARSSDGIAAKAGSSFELTRLITGEAAIGYVERTYKDPNVPVLRGLLVDASVLWAATGLTNVKLTVTTTPQETNLAGVAGVLSYDTGLQVEHAFRRWLIGTARLAYGIDDYVGSPRQDQRFAASAGLTYKLTRAVQVKGEVRHEWRHSNEPGNDYQATIGLIGLRWQP